jgi:DNA uptake protein ComE-like DNA-binding protein
MPKFTTPFWDKDGRLYRPGEEVPALALKASATAPAASTGGGDSKDALPDDFPAREALVGGGFKTLASVRTASDEELDGVAGIGPATIRDIRDWFGGV